VILAVNSKAVSTPDQLRHIIGKAGKHIALLVKRKDMEVYVPVDLG
jgi:serine protease Do